MRIRTNKATSEAIDKLKNQLGIRQDGTIARIAFAYSIQLRHRFEESDHYVLGSDFKDWRDERALFGSVEGYSSNVFLYHALLSQHYGQNLLESAFENLFRLHLEHGLIKLLQLVNHGNSNGVLPITEIIKLAQNGLRLLETESNPLASNESLNKKGMPEYSGPIEVQLGLDNAGNKYVIRLNDLKEFDSCNMAIAGMVGSGKTELVKDILFQISKGSNQKLKFIFFDYKGESSTERLGSFLNGTGCQMIDLKKEAFKFNPLSFISLTDERSRSLNIKSFIDFMVGVAPQLGSTQRHILQTVLEDCFDRTAKQSKSNAEMSPHPNLKDVNDALREYYEEHSMKHDTLSYIISSLSDSIFSNQTSDDDNRIYEKSLYINLPSELSDTLRQLCVFITLKYLLSVFTSAEDTTPNEDRIKPMRYVIVVDEAHVYLKNRKASAALEETLRVLRSKGVMIIMLTQGVEDFKTKNFDFASQIKIPICLNVNNKDYKLIESFLGTPKSKRKLEDCINGLEPQKGVINLGDPQVITINQYWKRSPAL